MSDASAVGAVVVTPSPKKPIKNVEIYLHALIVLAAIIAITIMASEKLVDGATCASLITAMTGISGIVTGIKTVQGKNGG